MLSELSEIQESAEKLSSVEFTISVETRCEESGESVKRQYTFDYTNEWDKWTFVEFDELRCDDPPGQWRTARKILWNEADRIPDIHIPAEVTDRLERVVDGDVTIQVPVGQNEYETR